MSSENYILIRFTRILELQSEMNTLCNEIDQYQRYLEKTIDKAQKVGIRIATGATRGTNSAIEKIIKDEINELR